MSSSVRGKDEKEKIKVYVMCCVVLSDWTLVNGSILSVSYLGMMVVCHSDLFPSISIYCYMISYTI